MRIMPDIQFDEPNIISTTPRHVSKPSTLEQLVINTELVKDEGRARSLLIVFAFAGILIAIITLWKTSSSTENVEVPPEVLRSMR